MPETASFQNILVVGLGTIGQQVALQCARFGFRTMMYDLSAEAIAACRQQQAQLLADWQRWGLVDAEQARQTQACLHSELDAATAARDCDLLIECVSEVRRVKLNLFAQFEPLCPPRTIFVTNSSYLTPSMLLRSVERKSQFAALHFHDPVWHANVVDIMPHSSTAPEVVERLANFARQIDQVPIICGKESPGYVFNAMLQAFLQSAIGLAASGVASVEDVDRAWMGVMKTPIGPFGILDRIGLETVRDIANFWVLTSNDPQQRKNAKLLEEMVASGKLGLKSGQGFYSYPQPAYERGDFLGGSPPPSDNNHAS